MLGKILGVVGGVIGASATIAGGVYTAQNPGLVKDYIKGNPTYTNSQMEEVKSQHKNEIVDLTNEIVNIKASYETVQAELNQEKAKVYDLEQSVTSLTATKKSNEETIASLTNSNTNLQTQVTTLTNEVAEKQASVTSLESQVATNNERIAELEAESEDNAEEIASLTQANASLNSQITSLNEDIQTKTTEISNLNSTISTQQTTITNLTNTNTELNNQITQLNGDIAEYQAQIAELEEQLENVKSIISFSVTCYGDAETVFLSAEEGMTFGEWVESEYNTCGATFDETIGYIRIPGFMVSVLYDSTISLPVTPDMLVKSLEYSVID